MVDLPRLGGSNPWARVAQEEGAEPPALYNDTRDRVRDQVREEYLRPNPPQEYEADKALPWVKAVEAINASNIPFNEHNGQFDTDVPPVAPRGYAGGGAPNLGGANPWARIAQEEADPYSEEARAAAQNFKQRYQFTEAAPNAEEQAGHAVELRGLTNRLWPQEETGATASESPVLPRPDLMGPRNVDFERMKQLNGLLEPPARASGGRMDYSKGGAVRGYEEGGLVPDGAATAGPVAPLDESKAYYNEDHRPSLRAFEPTQVQRFGNYMATLGRAVGMPDRIADRVGREAWGSSGLDDRQPSLGYGVGPSNFVNSAEKARAGDYWGAAKEAGEGTLAASNVMAARALMSPTTGAMAGGINADLYQPVARGVSNAVSGAMQRLGMAPWVTKGMTQEEILRALNIKAAMLSNKIITATTPTRTWEELMAAAKAQAPTSTQGKTTAGDMVEKMLSSPDFMLGNAIRGSIPRSPLGVAGLGLTAEEEYDRQRRRRDPSVLPGRD